MTIPHGESLDCKNAKTNCFQWVIMAPMYNPHKNITLFPTELSLYALVFIAGSLGAITRYLVSMILSTVAQGTLFSTILVNALGSFGIVYIAFILSARLALNPRAVKIVNSGFMGAFTTMSAYCTQVVSLVDEGSYAIAGAYAVGTMLITFCAALAAYAVARRGISSGGGC